MMTHKARTDPAAAQVPSGGFLDSPDSPAPRRSGAVRPQGHRFDAFLDCAELDDRMRPGHTWTARARELSRAHVIVSSRRMCYPGRIILLAIHLIDDAPAPLMGRVYSCDYDADALYRVDLDLLPMPVAGAHRDWFAARDTR
jgi:hypothetical protein